MKKIIIIGAGGLGREICWMIKRINEAHNQQPIWEILGFVDDRLIKDSMVEEFPILGDIASLLTYKESVSVVCSIANVQVRKRIIQALADTTFLHFPNLIDPSVIVSNDIKMGKGNIICAGCILTVDITLQDFNIINPGCTIGHDTIFGSFITVYPGANIAGNVKVGNHSELGTGMRIIQGKIIGSYVIIGAGSVIIHDIPPYCTAVGCPAIPLTRKSQSNLGKKD